MNNVIAIKKILHISKGSVGGLDTIVATIANQRKDKSILFFDNDPTNLYQKKVFMKTFSIGSEILFLKLGEWGKLISLVKDAFIVHVHLTNPIIFFLYPFLWRKKIIFSIHKNFGESYMLLYKSNLFKWLGFLLVKKISIFVYLNYINLIANKILVLTEYQKEIFRKNVILKKKFVNKTFVIGNFILEKNIINQKNIGSSPTIIFIGRLTKYKGFHDLVSVAKDLQEENITFLFIGDGVLKDELSCLKKVIYIPIVNNSEIYSYLDKADILVLPSYSESFGLVILEAMARGLGVICSDLPPIREFFKEGINGYMFPVGDRGALKERILHFIRHKDELLQISKNNLHDSHNYTEKVILEKYENIYNCLT